MYAEYQKFKKASAAKQLEPTPSDIEGPFYKAGAPFNDTLDANPSLHISGQVVDQDGSPIEAILDFWQADAQGVYDNTGFRFRGKVKNDLVNGYKLHTIEPGDYEIGPNDFRCAHIHVKVSAPGFKLLTTQLYFPDDPYNSTDHWFNPKMVIAKAIANFVFVLERQN